MCCPSADWQNLHGELPVRCETFVDEERFRGTCYRAANWERIGIAATVMAERKDARSQQPRHVFTKRMIVLFVCS